MLWGVMEFFVALMQDADREFELHWLKYEKYVNHIAFD